MGIQKNGNAEVELELETCRAVIEMSMGEDDELGFESETNYFFGDKVGFITRIDDGTFQSLRVIKQITVGAHFADGESFEFHDEMIQDLSLFCVENIL